MSCSAIAVDRASLPSLDDDPLRLDPAWPRPPNLIPFEEALDFTLLQRGISREAFLRHLAAAIRLPGLQPLLWLLPRRWRLAQADLPERLRTLAGVLERGFLSPALIATLADDLPHLLPSPRRREGSALDRWRSGVVTWDGTEVAVPSSLSDLLEPMRAVGTDSSHGPGGAATSTDHALRDRTTGLLWRNVGLRHRQSALERRANALLAQGLNRLAANLLGGQPWRFEAATTARGLVQRLLDQSWRVEGRLRCSVTSFGLGASVLGAAGEPHQVPLALPIRTGLLDGRGEECLSLLPHACLELRLERNDERLLLQYYQGTEGLCGWEGMNDLDRPWQNDPERGTVRVLGAPFVSEELLALLDLTEVIAAVHNREASRLHLRAGGYGTLGFCLDTAALLQQAMRDACDLFPLMLGGVWRERLLACSRALEQEVGSLSGEHRLALARYRCALEVLPLDVSHHGGSVPDAWRRLLASLPEASPFLVMRELRSRAPAV